MSDELKRIAAEAALPYIKDGMTVGLGTGSTADHFIRALGSRIAGGLKIRGVPTSLRSEHLARSLHIPLTEIEGANEIDLVVDGADEIDERFRLIKGAGGALLREKIVAAASREMIVIADDRKLVRNLGAFALPIEIVRFGVAATTEHIFWALKESGVTPDWVRLRENPDERPAPYITDSGNLIIDCACGEISKPEALAMALAGIPGVVEHGLFIGLATRALIGTKEGVRDIGPTFRPPPLWAR